MTAADGTPQARTPGPFSQPTPTAVLISGGGRTLLNLLKKQRSGELAIDIRLVIASKASAGGLRHAEEFGVDRKVVRRSDSDSPERYREAIFQPCRDAGAECVVMAGFLKLVEIPADFQDRVVNIHPSLIPSFAGEGFYGDRVHRAVIQRGVKLTGCTVHLVDNDYDQGPIILQDAVRVADDDTPETLAARVFQQECLTLVAALELLTANRLRVEGRRVVRI